MKLSSKQVNRIVQVFVLAVVCAVGTFAAATLSNAEVARARAATARYHDISVAEADGYVELGFCEPGEGCHWIKPSLVDGVVEPENPEILLYASGPNGQLRLVAVEYIVPIVVSPTEPEGFEGDEDLWREDTEGAGLWEMTAWIWFNNPAGMFEQHNPRLSE